MSNDISSISDHALRHGVAWYPELWTRDVWQADLDRMVQAGIDTVRIGEFLWSRIEPEEGKIDLSLLDQIFEATRSRGLAVVLCTPTVTPPIWYSHGHPERMHVDARGVTMGHGARQHACLNHPEFRVRTEAIVEALARQFGQHPALVLWQLDNEFKSQATECHCATCRGLWHHWLGRRYGSIEALNEAWGTGVFSQTYQRFDQVPTPTEAQPFLHNASLSTAYRRFSHETTAEFASFQAQILRRWSQVPVTTNGSIGFAVDNHLLFSDLDVAGYDTYADQPNHGAFALNLDFWRCVGPQAPFWLLETSPSHTGALERHSNVHPRGYPAAEAALAWVRGAQAFCYWLWRQHRHGCELSHGSVLSASGQPAAGWDDVVQVSRVRDALAPLIESTQLEPAQVVVTWSDRARAFWATEPFRKTDYRHQMGRIHGAFYRQNLGVDVVSEGADLTGYRLLITAFQPAPDEGFVERALTWVAAGGTWIVGPASGSRTEEHGVCEDAVLHHRIEEAAGVEALYSYPVEGSGAAVSGFGVVACLESFVTVLQPRSARVLATMSRGRDDGAALVTEGSWGRGRLVVVGGRPASGGDSFLDALVAHYAQQAGVKAPAEADPGIALTVRTDGRQRTLIAIDLGGVGGQVRPAHQPPLTLKPFGWASLSIAPEEK